MQELDGMERKWKEEMAETVRDTAFPVKRCLERIAGEAAANDQG